jgi:protein-L-isoaspartate(D-aspartate) O-methyltransferase
MTDAAVQRLNMVESQVMPSDVTDRRIIRAMGSVPRERFVPASHQAVAYMDDTIALGGASGARRGIMAPRVLGKMLQIADFGEKDRVLIAGAGTGYSAAVVAQFAKSVIALESDGALAAAMQETLASLGTDNVSVVTGELTEGWAKEGPYDVVLLDGAIRLRPQALLDQLKDGGRLVAIVIEDGIGKATLWRRLGRSFDARTAFDAAAPGLPGFEPAPQFAL